MKIAHWLIQVEHPYANFNHTFWGMLTLGTEGICANTFERERLEWLSAIPVEGINVIATMGDYISTPSAYKYDLPNSNIGEKYYFENHQQISIYDNGISNPDDKGIFILHLTSESYSGDCLRILTSDGFWDWKVPLHTDCWGNYLPVFEKAFVNRNGYGNRDKITDGDIAPEFLYSFINENYQFDCNDWSHGYGFLNAFDTTYNNVFSSFSNPPARTNDGNEVNFLMEVINQSGSILTASFETQNVPAGKPSKPPLGFDPVKQNDQYQNHTIYLAWGSDAWDKQPIEPDIEFSELQVSTDTVSYTTIYSGSNRFINESSFKYDSTGDSFVHFRVRVRDNQNKWSIWSNAIKIKINDDTRLNSTNDLISAFNVYQNYPNPFNSSTTISYQLPVSSNVILKAYDILGNEIETLVNEEKPAGTYEIKWSAANLPSGVYFYQLKAGDFVSSKKMILLK